MHLQQWLSLHHVMQAADWHLSPDHDDWKRHQGLKGNLEPTQHIRI